MIPDEELRFYRLIEERSTGLTYEPGGYKLACGHSIVVFPSYSERINYLPCPVCIAQWDQAQSAPAREEEPSRGV